MREFYEVISHYPFITFFLGLFILILTDLITDCFKKK